MMRPAFILSLQDFLGKLGASYARKEHFLHNFVGELYVQGARVTIDIGTDRIVIRSPQNLEERLAEGIDRGDIAAIKRVIPPTSAVEAVELLTGTWGLEIDKNRSIHPLDMRTDGTKVTLFMPDINQDEERGKIARMYAGTDLEMVIDGASLPAARGLTFAQEGLRGKISYDPRSPGKVIFFDRGRRVADMPLGTGGIDVMLHDHGLPLTITGSNVIRRGRGQERWDSISGQLPGLVAQYLRSDEALSLGEQSYQALVRTALAGFGSSEAVRSASAENILFYDSFGMPRYSLREVEAQSIKLSSYEKRIYDKLISMLGKASAPSESPPPVYAAPDTIETAARKNGRCIAIGTAIATPFVALSLMGALYVQGINSGSSIRPPSTQTATRTTTPTAATVTAYASPTPRETATPTPTPDTTGGWAGYRSNEELAQELASAPEDNSGYLEQATYNHMSLDDSGKSFHWTEIPGQSGFVSDVPLHLPPELADLQGQTGDALLSSVYQYFNTHFRYGGIYDTGTQDNIADEMFAEGTAYCSPANQLAAAVLADLSGGQIPGIRYTVGTLRGVSHAWLEVLDNADNTWKVLDFTPSDMTNSFTDVLNSLGGIPRSDHNSSAQAGAEMYLLPDAYAGVTGSPTQNILGEYANSDSSYAGATGLEAQVGAPHHSSLDVTVTDNLPPENSSAGMDLFTKLLLGILASSSLAALGVTVRNGRTREKELPAKRVNSNAPYIMQLAEMGGLFGMRVRLGREYAVSDNTLTVPPDALGGNAVDNALGILDHFGPDAPFSTEDVYLRITNLSR